MNRISVRMSGVAIAVMLALGMSACNRDAGAGLGAGAAGSASAAQAPAPAGPQYAKVISVDPVRTTVSSPKQICHDEVVSDTAQPKDKHQIAGTAIGAVAGGLLGHQVGGGKGKTLATIAGAVGGGYAGRKIQQHHQNGQVTTSTQQQCETVQNTSSKIVGYDVRYRYDGVTRTARMDHDPGDRVEVEQGGVAVSRAH